MFNDPKLKFERPAAHGWHSLVFPHINDLNYNVEVWIDDAFNWLDAKGISRRGLFWCLAHGKGKETERVSPVFFFKDHWSAIQFKWRFSGEFTSEGS